MRSCFSLRKVAPEDECHRLEKMVDDVKGKLHSLRLSYEELEGRFYKETEKNSQLSLTIENARSEYRAKEQKAEEDCLKKILLLTKTFDETKACLTQQICDYRCALETSNTLLEQNKHSCYILARDRERSLLEIASLAQELDITKEHLMQRNGEFKSELDRSNLLLEKEQQNCSILSKQLLLTRQRFSQEMAGRVDGAAALLISKLGDLVNDPISLQLIEDPVVLPSGNTIGSKQIAAMKGRGLMFDPFTRQLIGGVPLYKNLLFGHVLDAYKEFLSRAV
jgi:hypothetical protein